MAPEVGAMEIPKRLRRYLRKIADRVSGKIIDRLIDWPFSVPGIATIAGTAVAVAWLVWGLFSQHAALITMLGGTVFILAMSVGLLIRDRRHNVSRPILYLPEVSASLSKGFSEMLQGAASKGSSSKRPPWEQLTVTARMHCENPGPDQLRIVGIHVGLYSRSGKRGSFISPIDAVTLEGVDDKGKGFSSSVDYSLWLPVGSTYLRICSKLDFHAETTDALRRHVVRVTLVFANGLTSSRDISTNWDALRTRPYDEVKAAQI